MLSYDFHLLLPRDYKGVQYQEGLAFWLTPFSARSPGFSFGIGLTYPLCGFIIAHLGWRVVFYVTGSLGVVWCVFWWLLAFDSPGQHPRISPRELRYIQRNVANSVVEAKVRSDLPNLPFPKHPQRLR